MMRSQRFEHTVHEVLYGLSGPIWSLMLLAFVPLGYVDTKFGRTTMWITLGWWAIPFGIVDIILNCTLAWLVFRERPRELFLTDRFKRMDDQGDWRVRRFKAALNENDPNHV